MSMFITITKKISSIRNTSASMNATTQCYIIFFISVEQPTQQPIRFQMLIKDSLLWKITLYLKQKWNKVETFMSIMNTD